MTYIYLLTTSQSEEYVFSSLKKAYFFCVERLGWELTAEEILVVKSGGFVETGGWKENNPNKLRRLSLR